MDGVFMGKIIKCVICLLLILAIIGVLNLWQDHQILEENLIRLHVVGNSDSDHDQQIKLQLKDAIVEYLQPISEQFSSKEQAMEYIRTNLETIQEYANNVLKRLGVREQATVTLRPEAFDLRVYDTFSLPSGIYDSLRIQIGDAMGRNWWCVVFPSLCLPTTGVDFYDTAVSSGFSETLTNTLSNQNKYEVRFFLLDCIGKIKKLF